MTQLLQNAAYGTALILAAALLRRVLKDRLLPGARLALWAVCLFRLLTPAAPESVLSLWGLFASFAPVSQPSGPAYDTMSYFPPETEAFVPQIAEPGTSPDLYLKPAPFPWETVLLAVWLAVGIALAVRYALSWTRTRRAVAHAIPVERDDPRYVSLPKCARLREGPMEGAPLTFGVARPTVVLSPGLEGEALSCVLAHEGVHAQRRDNLWHYVMAVALIIHWWNPAVWLMARLLRRDIELSCDRAAVKKLGADRRAEYASALVSMATAAEGPAFCQTFGRKAAEERILSVMKFKKTSVIGVVLSLALVLAVTVGFACNPAKQKADDTIEYHGRVYNRSDLSQETLDWLDWYLSLSEEGQMSVSMVPPELIAGLTPDDYDAMPDEDAAPSDQPAWPVNSKGKTYGEIPSTYMSTFESPDLIFVSARAETDWIEGYIPYRQFAHPSYPGTVTDTGEEFTKYLEWLETQPEVLTEPLYDSEENIIGEFRSANPVKVSAEPAKAFDDYTIVGMDENGYPVDEQGNSLVFDDNGNLFMKVRSGYGPCIKTDCTVSGEHHHANGEVVYHYDTLPAQIAEPSSTSGHHGESHHGNGHH